MSWFFRVCRSSLGKKTIMALSGTLLGFFLLAHAAGNATIFWGPETFNGYARHLHGLGFLVDIAEILLLLLFLTHITLGILLTLQNRAARSESYAVRASAGGRSLGSRTMIWTGLVILVFLLVHLANFHFVSHEQPIASIVGPVLARPLYGLIYGLAMLALGLHVSHGFWSVFQTLGMNHPRYNPLFRGLGWAGCLLIAGVFLSLVVLLISRPHYLA